MPPKDPELPPERSTPEAGKGELLVFPNRQVPARSSPKRTYRALVQWTTRVEVLVEASDHDDARELAIAYVRDNPPGDHTAAKIEVVALEDEPTP